MAYDKGLAERLREQFLGKDNVEEKKMFGGLSFMVNKQLCCGIVKDTLVARVGAENYEISLKQAHVKEMDFTGKRLKGMVYISPEGIETDKELKVWVDLCLRFVVSLPKKK